MHAIAAFDRWLTQRCATTLPDAERRLRAALGARDTDWLGLLADDGQCQGTDFQWRLALWRRGKEPQWLSPPLHARAGQPAALLRREALGQALARALQA